MAITAHHINCGSLSAPNFGYVPCRCLLLDSDGDLTLVDAGIGLLDVRNPLERVGRELIELAGFQFHEHDTAVRRVEELGFRPNDVRNIILTHGDPDHAGGLADFPQATVHVSQEEFSSISEDWPRYLSAHFAHGPRWKVHHPTSETWFGLEARPIPVGSGRDVLLIPLFGHTKGHCGVAVRQGERWLLHVGDAYYLEVELARDDHPVSQLAALRADDNDMRIRSLAELRRLQQNHGDQITFCCYHDNDSLKSTINA